MRRQFTRIFSSITTQYKSQYRLPFSSFQFSTITQTSGYKTLFQQLKENQTNAESAQNILSRLLLYIPKLNIKELKELALTSFQSKILDEGQAQKIFDRTTKLFLEEKADLTDTLTILSAILQKGYSRQYYQQQYYFVAAVSQAQVLDASQISSAMYIYGQLISITEQKNDDVAEALYCHFKNQIDNFKSKDLRDYALGAIMAGEENDDVYDLLERQSLNVEMDLADLTRVVTVVSLNVGGSDELWKSLEESAVKNIPKADPQDVSQLLMLYKQLGHGTEQIFSLMEQSFLQNYDSLLPNVKLEMFAGFARVQHPSSKVFELFFKDIIKIIEQSTVKQVELLIFDCLGIYTSFPDIVQDYFNDYMIDNHEEMSEPVKEKILGYFKRNKLLTDELEVALQKK